MIYGTDYHVGRDDDWEDIVSERVGAEISGHEWVNVNGVTFDLKHHLGGSTIPHGRYTAISRDALWNLVWASDGRQPQADIILRAHVHYFVYAGDEKKLGIVMPALQGYGSKYGIRRCSGTVSIGLLSFDVEDDGRYSWEPHLLDSALLRIKPKRG